VGTSSRPGGETPKVIDKEGRTTNAGCAGPAWSSLTQGKGEWLWGKEGARSAKERRRSFGVFRRGTLHSYTWGVRLWGVPRAKIADRPSYLKGGDVCGRGAANFTSGGEDREEIGGKKVVKKLPDEKIRPCHVVKREGESWPVMRTSSIWGGKPSEA